MGRLRGRTRCSRVDEPAPAEPLRRERPHGSSAEPEWIATPTLERAESLAVEGLAAADALLDDLHDPPELAERHGLGRRLIVFGISVLVVTSLLLAVPGLHNALGDVGRMSLGWILAAIALEIASNVCFAVIFRAFFATVPARLARRVAWSEVGSGALLPGGGVTSYALGGVLLHRAGLSRRRIVVLSGGLFWLTTGVNALALGAGGVLIASGAAGGPRGFLYAWAPLIFLPVAAAVVLSAALLARRSERAWQVALGEGVQEALRTARHPNWRLLGALGYLGFDMAVLWCTFRALGYLPSVGALMLGYLIGYLATVIPIPGGIGVLEGGLAGALVLYGTPATKTIAAVLVYHAVAFWIPSLGGLLAYAQLRRPLRRPASTAGSAWARKPDSASIANANETGSFRGVRLG